MKDGERRWAADCVSISATFVWCVDNSHLAVVQFPRTAYLGTFQYLRCGCEVRHFRPNCLNRKSDGGTSVHVHSRNSRQQSLRRREHLMCTDLVIWDPDQAFQQGSGNGQNFAWALIKNDDVGVGHIVWLRVVNHVAFELR